ncbi:uncharacterized protein EAE97_004737 [Botrytis byssoidea]|uniref:Uncharacterized protein n=1 Tax=Botrytis byssoidea TaxID=139641 RepID=A0A9P5IL45_9HELO|nr:uncharacterized protein EAE97_004737 [Botrytis byssoidea]KAF7945699.1 hypothetical protein EAE97_004737 [Botrytis byssoidea]
MHAPRLILYRSLEPKSAQGDDYPNTESFAPTYARDPKLIAQPYAIFIAVACSSLGFTQIGSWAWKVKRLEKRVETKKLSWKVTMEESDAKEKSAIHLFILPDLVRRSIGAHC